MPALSPQLPPQAIAMKPVLRVIVPTVSLSVNFSTDTNVETSLGIGSTTDYITENLSVPAGAIYAAQMSSDGKTIAVLVDTTVKAGVGHTYLGWPLPASAL